MSRFRAHFEAVAELLDALRGRDETTLAWYEAEASDFARLNGAAVRQAGQVEQRRLHLALIDGHAQARAALDLAGDLDVDRRRLGESLARLRTLLAVSSPDPHLLYRADGESSVDERRGTLPPLADALADITAAADGLDLVGVWAAGEVARGFASSAGTRRWHSRDGFNLDWSVHTGVDLAVKNDLAGEHWQSSLLAERLAADRERVALLARPPRTLAPGRWRALLAPAALGELMQLLSWGGFGLRSLRNAHSPLVALERGERRLHPAVTLAEQPGTGLAPRFTPDGFALPPSVTLVDRGGFGDALVSPRSAREFDAEVNSADESPHALVMHGGTMAHDERLARLGDGIEVSNLWYCNYADRNDARVTGMTRFACFVVEGGERVAPLASMRFDDSLYGLLGDRLLAVTAERELLADAGTYDHRSLAAMLLPGVLVEDLRLVL